MRDPVCTMWGLLLAVAGMLLPLDHHPPGVKFTRSFAAEQICPVLLGILLLKYCLTVARAPASLASEI